MGFRRVFRGLGRHLGERGLNCHAGMANLLTNAKAFHDKTEQVSIKFLPMISVGCPYTGLMRRMIVAKWTVSDGETMTKHDRQD